MPRLKHTRETIRRARELYTSGMTFSDVAVEMDVARSSVFWWSKDWDAAIEKAPDVIVTPEPAAPYVPTQRDHDIVEDIEFLLTRGGEFHAENIARRTGFVSVNALRAFLNKMDRADLTHRMTGLYGSPYGDIRDTSEMQQRAYLPVRRSA